MGKNKDRKKKEKITIEELRKQMQAEANANSDMEIEDAEFTDSNGVHHKREDALHVGSKKRIKKMTDWFYEKAEEMEYRTAAGKFKKAVDEDSKEEPADLNAVKQLRMAAIDAVQKYATSSGLDRKYADEIVDLLNTADPKRTVKIAEAIQAELASSDKLKTWNEWHRRGQAGEGWYYNEKTDDYEVDKLYGLPMDPEAAKEIGRIRAKYEEPFNDGWDGFWYGATPEKIASYNNELDIASEASKRAQNSYHRFIADAFGF